MVEATVLLGLALVAFAGGAVGAAIGGYQALGIAGLLIVLGEGAAVLNVASIDAGLAPAFGPHVAFVGGVAAAAYAARQGYLDEGPFGYHPAKNVTTGLGARVDLLVVGGVFGAVGFGLARASAGAGLPWDPIAFAVVVSALLHRIVLGFPLIGTVHGESVLDMSPFDAGERRTPLRPDGGSDAGRYAVEPWLPHQYRWHDVAALGAVVGVVAAFLTLRTANPYFAFGLAAASLLFVSAGVDRFPVVYHMALVPSFAAVGLAGGASSPEAMAAETALSVLLLGGAAFGAVTAVFGELFQRLLYAHADTHFDAPMAAVLVGTLLVSALQSVGLLAGAPVPTI